VNTAYPFLTCLYVTALWHKSIAEGALLVETRRGLKPVTRLASGTFVAITTMTPDTFATRQPFSPKDRDGEK